MGRHILRKNFQSNKIPIKIILVQNGDATRGKAVGSIPWTLQALEDAGGTDDNKKEGLQFSVQTQIPKECNATEKFCAFLLKHIGEGKTLRLNGELTPAGGSLRFDLGEINKKISINKKFTFMKASLILTWIYKPPDGRFEIEGTMNYGLPSLTKEAKAGTRRSYEITETGARRAKTDADEEIGRGPEDVPTPEMMKGSSDEALAPEVSDPIEMIAKLAVTISGDLKLTLQVNRASGYHPFKLSSITFTEFALKIGFNWYTLLPNFETNGELYIGDDSTPMDKRIKLIFAGGGSVNPTKPSFFVYAETNAKITLQAFLDAHGKGLKLPEFIKDTGFPNGFECSIAFPEGTSVTEVHGLELPAGVRFRGDIALLGMEMSIDLQVSKTLFRFNATIKEPLNFAGGAFVISNWDKTAGPYVYFALTPKEKTKVSGQSIYERVEFKLQMSAWISFLGMGVGALIDIDERHMAISVEVQFFNIISTTIDFRAMYAVDKGIQKGNRGWTITACIKVLKTLEEEVENDALDTVKKVEEVAADQKTFETHPKYIKFQNKIKVVKEEMESQNAEVEQLEKEFNDLKTTLDPTCIAKCAKIKGKHKKYKFTSFKNGFISSDIKEEEHEDPKCIAQCADNKSTKKKELKLAKSKAAALGKKIKKYEGKIDSNRFLFDLENSFSDFSKKVGDWVKTLKEGIEQLKKTLNNAIKNLKLLFTLDAACLENTLQLGHMRFKFKAHGKYTMNKVTKPFQFVIVLDPGHLLRQLAVKIAKLAFPAIENMKKVFGMYKEAEEDVVKDLDNPSATALLSMKMFKRSTIMERRQSLNPNTFRSATFKRLLHSYNSHSDNADATDTFHKKLHRRLVKAYERLPKKIVLRDDETMRLYRDIYDADEEPKEENQDTSDERSFGGFELGTDFSSPSASDDKGKQCRRAHQVMNVYKGVYEMLDKLVKKNKATRDEMQAFLDDTKVDYDEYERNVIRKAKLDGYSEERIEDTMFFVDQMKNGLKNWQKKFERDEALADKISFNSWKKGVSDYFSKLNIDPVTFVKTMEDLTKDASKRWRIPESESKVIDSISIASQKLGELLESAHNTPFTEKREAIESLGHHVTIMKDSVSPFTCDGEAEKTGQTND